jgi:hypothetical protein
MVQEQPNNSSRMLLRGQREPVDLSSKSKGNLPGFPDSSSTNERQNMTKFIKLKTVSGADLLLRTKYIFSICGCPEKSFTRIQLCNAIDHDDAYDVVQTVDEVQAMMQAAEAKDTP